MAENEQTPTGSARHTALPQPVSRLLKDAQAAAYMGVSPNTFRKLVSDGLMPQPLRFYDCVRWDVRALDAAIDALANAGHDGGGGNEWDEVLG